MKTETTARVSIADLCRAMSEAPKTKGSPDSIIVEVTNLNTGKPTGVYLDKVKRHWEPRLS